MRIFANLLSVLLHPLWMPTLSFWSVVALDRQVSYTIAPEGRWILLAMVFAMTGLFPLTSTLVMLRSRMIGSLTLPDRRERIPVYVITLLYYGMCYYLLRRTAVNGMLLSIFFGALVALVFTLLINLRWKISAHMVGVGGFIGALLAVVMEDDVRAPFAIVLAFAMAGLLGTARLFASDHSSAQVHAGALLGGACVFGCTLTGLWI